MPVPAAPDVAEGVKEVYWRLNQPMSGSLLEVYWPPEDDWMPAKFVMVPEDGRVRVKWIQEGSTSEMPSHFVRNPGDGTEDPPIKRYLRTARPDWSEGDIAAVLAKLGVVGIAEARELYEAVLDDLNGYSDGVNGLLKAHRQRVLVPRTLNALKATGERMLGRRRPKPEDLAPAAPAAPAERAEPRQVAAEARGAADAQQPPRPPAQGARQGGFGDAPEGPPATEGETPFNRQSDASPHDVLPPKLGYLDAPPPAKNDNWHAPPPPRRDTFEDDSPPKLVPASTPAANTTGWAEDSFLASRVSCKNGHALSKEPSPYDVNCDECGAELDEGALMWRCDPCAFDLCLACHVVKQRKAGGLPLAQQRPQSSPLQPEVQARAPVVLPPEEPRVYCPKRHPLKNQHPSHPVECNYCGKEMTEKVRAWSCGICGYHLCGECHADKAMD